MTTQEKVWLDAYCAALQGSLQKGDFVVDASQNAQKAANWALDHFKSNSSKF